MKDFVQTIFGCYLLYLARKCIENFLKFSKITLSSYFAFAVGCVSIYVGISDVFEGDRYPSVLI